MQLTGLALSTRAAAKTEPQPPPSLHGLVKILYDEGAHPCKVVFHSVMRCHGPVKNE